MKPGERTNLDDYFVRLANEQKYSKPIRVVKHTQQKNKDDKTLKRAALAIFVIGSLVLGAGIAFTHTQNEMIEERGGTIDWVYGQEKTITNLNGSEKPTFGEVVDKMFGKGK